MTNEVADQTQIALAPDVLVKARGRARALGLTLSEYVRSLVDKDAQATEQDPWRQPVPKEIDEQWERELAEFEAEDRRGLQPAFNTVEELINDLES
ncbi:MAG: hypothetical protein HC802_07540 [Caldilineaceae bacterium]|nr:hypothetical protein [Caldilineaceae bacterium]